MLTLSEMISPIEVAAFFSSHWQRSPLHIPGNADKFAKLPGVQDLPAILSGRILNGRWFAYGGGTAIASFIGKDGSTRSIKAVPAMWPELFNAGASLCFSALDQYNEELNGLVTNVKNSTKLPGNISTTCYLTPPHSGSAMHLDAQHVFFLQIEGKKLWTIGQKPAWQDAQLNLPHSFLDRSAVVSQLEEYTGRILTSKETGTIDIELSAGDVLYMPPGVWHQGRTEASHSLHYTLTFMPLTIWNIIESQLRISVLKSPILKRDIRYVKESGGNSISLISSAIEELQLTLKHCEAQAMEDGFIELMTRQDIAANFLKKS